MPAPFNPLNTQSAQQYGVRGLGARPSSMGQPLTANQQQYQSFRPSWNPAMGAQAQAWRPPYGAGGLDQSIYRGPQDYANVSAGLAPKWQGYNSQNAPTSFWESPAMRAGGDGGSQAAGQSHWLGTPRATSDIYAESVAKGTPNLALVPAPDMSQRPAAIDQNTGYDYNSGGYMTGPARPGLRPQVQLGQTQGGFWV